MASTDGIFRVLLFVLLSLSVLTPQFLVNSQTFSNSLPISVDLMEFTQESISNNTIYYIEIQGFGLMVYLANESRFSLENLSITSTLYASSLAEVGMSGVPLKLKGVVMLPPKVINDTVYFAYAPGATVLKDLNPKTVLLAYAKFSFKNGWGSIVNVTSNGIVRSFDVFGNKVYVLFIDGNNRTHVLVIEDNVIVKDIQIKISNPFQIEVINDNLILISNSTAASYLSYVFNTSISQPALGFNYFILNLSSGKIVKLGNYNNLEPYLVYPVNGSVIAAVYQDITTSLTSNSFLVLYDLQKNMSIINIKSFSKTSIYQIIANDGYIIVARMQLSQQYQGYKFIIEVYNSSLALLNTLSFTSSFFPIFQLPTPYAIIENQSSIIAVMNIFQIEFSQSSISMFSTIDLQEIGSKPLPFNVYVSQIRGNGYTLLNITWDKNIDCTYRIYINGTLVGITKNTNFVYNVTQNGTYLIKVVAINNFGSKEKQVIVEVTVNPLITTTQTTTTSITTQQTTTTTFTTQTQATTNTTITQLQQQATTTQVTEGLPLLPIIVGVIIAVIIIVVVVLILRRR